MSMIAKLLRRQPAESLVIEPLRRKHLGAVLDIEQVSYPKPWTTGVFQSELEMARRGERVYLVALSGGVVIGYAGILLIAGDAHVSNIAVHPDWRRQRLGARLLAELAWSALDHQCTALTLEGRITNTAAQDLYRLFGFEAAGIRKRYYENIDDAIVMWCTELATPQYRQMLVELCPEAAR